MPKVDFSNADNMGDKKAAKDLTVKALNPYLTALYNQDSLITKYFPKWADIPGICLGVSLHWIRLHQSSRNTPRLGEQGLLQTNQMVVEARKVQLVYQGSLQAAGATDRPAQQAAISAACISVKAAIVGALTHHRLDDAALMTKLRQVHRYHVISLIGGINGGHAVAAYMSSGKIFGLARHVYLFDSNIGELRIPEGDLEYVIDAMATYYRVNGQKYTACYLSEIKP